MAENYKVSVEGGTVGYYTVSGVNSTEAAEHHDSVGSGFVVGRVTSTGDGARAFSSTTLVNGQGRGVNLTIADADKNYWTVNMSNYADKVVINSDYSTVNLGAGNDSVSVGGANVTVTGGLGNDVATLAGPGAVADLGAGNDSVVVSEDATITLGSGNDTVSVGGNATATISDYSYDDDVLQVASVSAPTFTSAGVLSVGDEKFNLGTSAASYKAKVTDGTNTQRYWWVGANATTLNAMSETRDLIMSGQTNKAGDQILGGKGNDTIYAGADDTVWGGFGGNDTLIGLDNEANAFAYVAGTKSKAVVSGFKTGFGSTADSLYFLNLADAYKAPTLNGGKLGVTDADTSLDTGVEITTNEITNVKAQVNGFGTYKVGFGAGHLTLSTANNDMQIVYGLGGGTDMLTTSANYMNQEENGLKVDLSNSGLIGDQRLYININNYDGGTADPNQTYMVIGSGKGGSLRGGTGSKGNSLWGGFGGADTLKGSTNTKDTFFFAHGNGNDVVSGYETNYDSLQFLTTDFGGITAETVAGGKQDVKITMGSGDTQSTLTVEEIAADGAISFTADGTNYSKAKVFTSSGASSRSYARDVDFYLGKGIDTLTVGADVTADGVTIALDGSDGKFYEDVDVLDASKYTGAASLTGSAQNQTIIASTGGSTLYGGSGSSNDTLVGGNGADTFIYHAGNGNDVIQSVGSDDTIMLYDVSLSDLTTTETTAGLQIKVGSTSQTLTVEGSNAGQATFVVDGTKYHITNESGNYTWKQA